MFWTDCELTPELTSSQRNWKGNKKGKGTYEIPHHGGALLLSAAVVD